jgi:hypothetical protein
VSRVGVEKETVWILPMESAAIITVRVKITLNLAASVRFYLGREEARKFYTKPKHVVNRSNKERLGWLNSTFDLVNWTLVAAALESKPEMAGLWLAKQSIGICATWKNLARIQDILDNRCQNCGTPREDNLHLNRCPNPGCDACFETT